MPYYDMPYYDMPPGVVRTSGLTRGLAAGADGYELPEIAGASVLRYGVKESLTIFQGG
jgi:hypothetical protein